MVLSRRTGTDAESSAIRYDGTTNVHKFFFVFEQAVMRGTTDEEKAAELIGHLDSPAFDFYYDEFAKDGELADKARDYNFVKTAMIEQFKPEEQADDMIRRAMAARLNYGDLLGSLRDMDRLFEKANFNDAAKFGLLRNAVMEHLDLAQFAVYRGVNDYENLKKAVKDFWNGRQAFQSSAVFSHLPANANASMMSATPRDLEIVPAKKLLLRPDARVAKVEDKVDALAGQLSQLTLQIKKQATLPPGGPSSQGKVCSFCKKSGHGANRCDINPHRDTICTRCGKRGHSESTCWTKVAPEVTKKVGFSAVKSESQAEKKLASRNSEQAEAEQVSIVTETDFDDDDLVAAMKRDAQGQALPKQTRSYGIPVHPPASNEGQRKVLVPINVETPVSRATAANRLPYKTKPRKSRTKKTSKKAGIADLVGKYHMLAELARAPCGLTFGQLMRGDADEAKREIRRLFSSKVSRSVLAQVGGPPRRLKVVSIPVYGTITQALLDSGAVPNLMSSRLARSLSLTPEPTTKRITVADGTNAVARETVTGVPVSFGGLTEPLDFLLVQGTPFDVIIGCPALGKLQACLDLGQQQVTITINGESVQLGFEYDSSRYRLLEPGTDSEDFTSDIDDIDAPQEILDGSSSDDEEFVVAVLDETPFEPDLQIAISPELLDFEDDDEDFDDLPDLLEIDPESDWESDSDSDSESGYCADSEPDVGNSSDSDDNGDCCVAAVTTALSGQASQQEIQDQRSHECYDDSSEEVEEDRYASVLAAKLAHLPSDVQNSINATLRDSGVVAWSLDDLLPAKVPITHAFELKDDNPIHSRVRRLPPRHTAVVRQELDKMLEAGIVTPFTSAWSFPVVIATKKDGQPRFFVDYRTLNRVMKADRWPLPKIEEIFDDLEGSSVFTTLDLFSGYWQVRMDETCKEKSTFVCRFGTFQFEVMPFGLMNAPSTFQRMMDFVFREFDCVRVYLDDVVVYSQDLNSHIVHLQEVFQAIASHGLKIKVSKCSFAQSKVKLLGHVIDTDGVAVDPDKISAIKDAPKPNTTTELRSFLGLAGYYRRFIRGFAEISACLHAGTSANLKFAWTEEMQSAFEELKAKLTSPPVLAFPDFDSPSTVETDASLHEHYSYRH